MMQAASIEEGARLRSPSDSSARPAAGNTRANRTKRAGGSARLKNMMARRSMVTMLLLAIIFFSRADPPARFVLFALVFPAAGLALLSEGLRNLAPSSILAACIIY